MLRAAADRGGGAGVGAGRPALFAALPRRLGHGGLHDPGGTGRRGAPPRRRRDRPESAARALSARTLEDCGLTARPAGLFVNVLYIDPAAVPELAEAPKARAIMDGSGFRERLQAARAAELVDYRAVAELKRPVLEALFERFRQRHLGRESARGRAFDAFRSVCGPALRRHAVFEALAERFEPGGGEAGSGWPEEYRSPDSPAVAAFAERHAERIAFFEYLQWLADEQFAQAAGSARDGGLSVGLYRDLAISSAGHGAEAWGNRGLHARGASIGSPPDDFNLHGQDWGLPPLIPERLMESAYEPFIATLRWNMRHAGALRIDHVMGLMRLYWVPDGRSAEEGAYVHYPLYDLLGILALESRRNRCMVVGEDLGTVPGRGARRAGSGRGPVLPRALFRARGRRGLPGAGGLPRAGAGDGQHA
ncbi:MAG: 4-alpha-glucanotransferase [Halofilum sp. (in: g-proteobacteria)]|nr:4-alpha-glucanotransferase [Halofilum sp. (in: g-proteobacteria)]